MVVSHRETSISSNIRAIIEQLNLNPVERRRLIDRTNEEKARCRGFQKAQSPPKITIGVYGCGDRLDYHQIPGPIRPISKMDERPRLKVETPRRVASIKKDPLLLETVRVEQKDRIKYNNNNEDWPRMKQEQRRQPIPAARKETVRVEDAIECRAKPEERRATGRVVHRVQPKPEVKPRITAATRKEQVPIAVRESIESPRSSKDIIDRTAPVAKEDLPELESASLNHTAALHRISVRPKNRRPPRRSGSQTADTSSSTITTIVEDVLDSLDQQDLVDSPTSSPMEPKATVTRKPSSRLSRTSDIFEELESKLPKKPSSMASLSPDSLDTTSASRTSVELNEEQVEVRSIVRKASNRISKGSDIFEELEAKLPRRISSSTRLSKSPDSLETSPCWFSKSSDAFDKLVEYEEVKPVVGRLANPISKSTDRVSKSSDSLEAIEALTSDESIERRRSSFEFGGRRTSKTMSKSSENFEVLDQAQNPIETIAELQKRSSISDMNLARGRRLSKSISESSESFEIVEADLKNAEIDMDSLGKSRRRSSNRVSSEGFEIVEADSKDAEVDMDSLGKCRRRSSNRMSSESSDNLELDDRLENRRVRRSSKRIASNSFIDIVTADDREEEKRSVPVRKPSRLQKSSESSELGSTDTLDSERRHKSSESTETLDSLERDLDQDRRQEEIAVSDVISDRRDKNECWANRNVVAAADADQTSMADGTEEKSLISPDKFYWRQSSESKENLDIHQLLAITIVTRMADNGNNQRSSVIYPKKKQQISTSQPTSPVTKQEDNKMLFDNLLVSKNDEDLQNMLNGNISEVSTDTKSFKEKLIMFEKLGK